MFTEGVTNGLKILWSYFYRLLIVLTVSCILSKEFQFQHKLIILVVGMLLWMLMFHWIRKQGKSIVRLMFDYIPIVITTLVSSGNSFELMFLVFLPIINNANHTASSKEIIGTVIFSLLWILTLLLAVSNITPYDIVIGVSVVLIIWFDYLLSKIRNIGLNFEKTTYSLIDSSLEITQLHLVLEKLKNQSNRELKIFRIEDIFLFEAVNGVQKPRIGTKYIPNLSLELTDAKYSENPTLVNTNVKISNINTDKNFNAVSIEYSAFNAEYSFVFLIEVKAAFVHMSYSILPIVFSKSLKNLLRIYSLKRNIELRLGKSRKMMIEKAQYISSVRAAAHFIRNNMTPFVALNTQLELFLKKERHDGELVVLEDDLKKSNEVFQKKIEHVESYIDSILQSPKNDILLENFKIVAATYINKAINDVLEEYSIPSSAVVSNDFDVPFNEKKFKIKSNNLMVLLDNIVCNMNKHGEDIVAHMVIHKNHVDLIFANSFKASKTADVSRYVKDLDSDSKESILRRSSDGVWLIKTTIENLEAKLSTVLDTKNRNFEIRIQIDGVQPI